MMSRLICVCLCALQLATATPVWADHQTYRIALFTTRSAGDPYWGQVIAVAKSAADDLDMVVQPFYAEGDHFRLIHQVEDALKHQPPFDALIVPNFKATAHRNIRAADAAGVPLLLFNSDVVEEQRATMGAPRQHFKHWIGRILPDEERAGAQQLELLLQHAQSHAELNVPVEVIALAGNAADYSSILRTRGLQRQIEAHPSLILKQLVYADWEYLRARSMTTRLLRRYPQARLGWTASDMMALGAAAAAEDEGVPLWLGGVDWSIPGLKGVLSGQLAVTMGGHFLNGGWAVVLLHDYLHGIDLDLPNHTLLTPMQPLTQADHALIQTLLGVTSWDPIDFRTYSKRYRPDLPTYPFDVMSLLYQLQSPAAQTAE